MVEQLKTSFHYQTVELTFIVFQSLFFIKVQHNRVQTLCSSTGVIPNGLCLAVPICTTQRFVYYQYVISLLAKILRYYDWSAQNIRFPRTLEKKMLYIQNMKCEVFRQIVFKLIVQDGFSFSKNRIFKLFESAIFL